MTYFRYQIERMLSRGEFFESGQPVWMTRAPGRLDVMGGNVDYTGGLVLQGLLGESVSAAAQNSHDGWVQVLNPGAKRWGWERELAFPAAELDNLSAIQAVCDRSAGTRWGKYVLGCLHWLAKLELGLCQSGMRVFLDSDLPPNRGVASSAALEIAVLKAASAAVDRPLEGVGLATAAQWVENVVVGAACGVMDQAAITLGHGDALLPILCQPCEPRAPLKLPPEWRIWGIDSMVARSTASAAYDQARAAAFMGYKLICRREKLALHAEQQDGILRWIDGRWNGHLSNVPIATFRADYEQVLPERMRGEAFLAEVGEHMDALTTIDPDEEYPVRAAVRYAVEENHRVRTMAELLNAASFSESTDGIREQATGLELAGQIFCQSHQAYRECGLGSDACDELVERARRAGLPGAKMTGGGGGGVVAVLGTKESEALVYRIAQEYSTTRGARSSVFSCCDGGDAVLGADAFGVHLAVGQREQEALSVPG
jgi:galactokinase